MKEPDQFESQPSEAARIKVLMDIGPAVHQRAGLSRYTERLASNLIHTQSADVNLVTFYNHHSNHKPPESLSSIESASFDSGQYRWRIGSLLSQLVRKPQPDVAHLVNSYAIQSESSRGPVYHATEHLLPFVTCPSVLTVHDLIFVQLPQHHTRTNRLFLKVGMPLFVRHATEIIAVSSQTKSDLISHYGIRSDRIHVVHEGIDEQFVPARLEDVHRIRRQYSQEKPYLLMVGSVEPRKNHIASIHALEQLKREGYPHRLLIAGGKGWMMQPILNAADTSSAADRIIFLDFVPQADLAALYSAADCLLLPSYYEGFGFTALEAMACSTPVVCSNQGSLPEIVGDAALQVHPDDVDGFTHMIRLVLNQTGLANELRRRGLANAAQYKWDRCARSTVDVYREALAVHA